MWREVKRKPSTFTGDFSLLLSCARRLVWSGEFEFISFFAEVIYIIIYSTVMILIKFFLNALKFMYLTIPLKLPRVHVYKNLINIIILFLCDIHYLSFIVSIMVILKIFSFLYAFFFHCKCFIFWHFSFNDLKFTVLKNNILKN